MKSNSQPNTILNDEIGGKESIKKKTKSIRLTRQTRNPGHETRTTQ
jgi:hypothetical protein